MCILTRAMLATEEMLRFFNCKIGVASFPQNTGRQHIGLSPKIFMHAVRELLWAVYGVTAFSAMYLSSIRYEYCSIIDAHAETYNLTLRHCPRRSRFPTHDESLELRTTHVCNQRNLATI